jgi:hypothetical protein
MKQEQMNNYETAVNESSYLMASSDWNYQFRANLAARGLCLSILHERGAMADRYPDGVPWNAPRPWPGREEVVSGLPPYPAVPDGWPDETQIVWLDHPGASPL